MAQIVTRTLECGTPLLVEVIPGVRSAGLSWITPAGYGADPEDRQGISAIWSELLLRGAGDLRSREHADALDRLGVNRGIDVGPTFLRLGASLLGDRLDEALPLLADIILRPRMDEESVEPSRELALQALESLDDDPQERAVLAARDRHHAPPFNRSGLGTEQGLRSATREELVDRWKMCAVPEGSAIAVAGFVDPDQLEATLNRLLRGWSGRCEPVEPVGTPPRGYAHQADDSANQVQIVVVHDAPREADERSVLERIVAAVLSGGMSSRLFTEVREKRGLCYAVHAAYRANRDFGAVTAYVGTTPERAQESLDVLLAELERVRNGVRSDELERALVGLKSRIVFSGESTGARASALTSDWHKLGRTRSLEEVTAEIDAVTAARLAEYLASRDLGRVTIQTLGPSPLSPPPSVSA